VTTPGLGRPLQTARDFRRQRGHEVSIVRGGAAPSLQGVVLDADDQAVMLEVDGSEVQVPLSDVVRGKVVLPW
jgi:ribosome maturation factor RimP